MPDSTPPVLPLRDDTDKPSIPTLPPRNNSDTSTITDNHIHYGFSDSLSVISVIRQIELYSSPQLNETSDLIVNQNTNASSTGNDNLRLRLDDIKNKVDIEDDNVNYWISIIQDYSNQFIRTNDKIEEFETHLIKGIPTDLRALVYLKTLQIRYKLNHKESFDSLIKKAKYSTYNQDHESFIKSLNLESSTQDIVEVYNYYINEVSSKTNLNPDVIVSYNAPSSFILSVTKVVSKIPHLEPEEIFYVLLKVDKLFHSLIKEEFYYKINRSLEDLVHKVFLHISVQGIYLNDLYKDILFNYFEHKITDPQQLLVILDFIIFEGFDFVLRLILSVFIQHKDNILKLEGDELSQFLNSSKLFENHELNLSSILKSQPQIIKYENEYHLIHANSLNNNQNELTNLQEVNDDLLIKINELNRQLENLRTTHTEITQQSDEYNVQLDEAKGINSELTSKMNGLQTQIKELTMEDNLNNTIQANKDFEERNNELEAQIEQVKNDIEKKKLKLAKLGGATTVPGVVASPITHDNSGDGPIINTHVESVSVDKETDIEADAEVHLLQSDSEIK
ncbi:hypothetical protein DFJ63DRAFT_311734 [Scheffersomyces coipomensis]|uniref:uncharacterized protein n=1 Tax=Scheffersomyces coipomensis TaxID=1788519 RepID=UPI00315C625C